MICVLGQEIGSMKLQDCQSDLSSREGYGADHLEHYCMTCIGQLSEQKQPGWISEVLVLTLKSNLLL